MRCESNFLFCCTREYSDGVQSCSAGASSVANILCMSNDLNLWAQQELAGRTGDADSKEDADSGAG